MLPVIFNVSSNLCRIAPFTFVFSYCPCPRYFPCVTIVRKAAPKSNIAAGSVTASFAEKQNK